MKLVHTAWMSWLVAALLFFSGKGSGAIILLFLALGFGLTFFAIARFFLRSHDTQSRF